MSIRLVIKRHKVRVNLGLQISERENKGVSEQHVGHEKWHKVRVNMGVQKSERDCKGKFEHGKKSASYA